MTHNILQALNVGIVGCGSIARAHIKGIQEKIEGIRFTAYYNRTLEKARQFLNEFGGDIATDDIQLFSRLTNIQAVYVCSAHNVHLEQLEVLKNMGVPIFMEKPLVLLHSDFEKMWNIIDKHEVRFFSGYKTRFNPLVSEAKKMIGKPYLITAQVADKKWDEGRWTSDPEKGGGHIISQGVYAADALRYLSDSEPVEVFAVGVSSNSTIGTIDKINATYTFNNGSIGNLSVVDTAVGAGVSKFFTQAFGERLNISLMDRNTTLFVQRQNADKPEKYTAEESGFIEQSRIFFNCIRNSSVFPMDFREGWMPSEMIFCALKSVQLKKIVKIDANRLGKKSLESCVL
ncbi:MAG TPA: hypothetical protein DC049_14085 [Spirochaetia bacterium]|nr:hypothetical protein [Spirochaetia bacterium]